MNASRTECINERVNYLLSTIFPDFRDRQEVQETIIYAVISDIESCADWSNLEDDEVCFDDIDIAVSRTIYKKVMED